MIIFADSENGTAYAALDGALIATPLYEDLTFDTCTDNWYECDMEHCEAEGIDAEGIYKKLVLCEEMC